MKHKVTIILPPVEKENYSVVGLLMELANDLNQNPENIKKLLTSIAPFLPEYVFNKGICMVEDTMNDGTICKFRIDGSR